MDSGESTKGKTANGYRFAKNKNERAAVGETPTSQLAIRERSFPVRTRNGQSEGGADGDPEGSAG